MKCPVCKSEDLYENIMSTGLKGYKCAKCDGSWVRFDDYDLWKKEEYQQPEDLTDYLPEYDYKKAVLCPDCGVILIKYKVAKDIPFNLDHCSMCNGVWFNKTEWENLIRNNLHHQMNSFFTKPWQNKLKEEMTKDRFEQKYLSSFGEKDYKRIIEVRNWLLNHPKKDELVNFIINDNPYVI
jgi:Zn-finger nucleic acid-binding protein